MPSMLPFSSGTKQQRLQNCFCISFVSLVIPIIFSFLILYISSYPYESKPRSVFYRTHTLSFNSTHEIIPIEGIFYYPINKNLWVSENGDRILGFIQKNSSLFAPLNRLTEVLQQFVYRRPKGNYKCTIRQRRQLHSSEAKLLQHHDRAAGDSHSSSDSTLMETVQGQPSKDEENKYARRFKSNEENDASDSEHEDDTATEEAPQPGDTSTSDGSQEEEEDGFDAYEHSTSAADDSTVTTTSSNNDHNNQHASSLHESTAADALLESTFETAPYGVIRFDWHSPSHHLQNGWNQFDIECGEPSTKNTAQKAMAYIWHGDPNSKGYAVISDIDDTIKVTEVKRPMGLLQNVFFRAHRPTHKGLSKVYTNLSRYLAALNHDNEQESTIPFHYVSSSPYGLHDTLIRFLNKFGFPLGTLHLKKAAFQDRTMHHLFKSSRRTKPPLLRKLLKSYPKRSFILIGDSSEHDPLIYANLYREFGAERIALIAIHCVNPKQCTEKRIERDFKGTQEVPEEKYLFFESDADFEKQLVERGFLKTGKKLESAIESMQSSEGVEQVEGRA